jgi:hypothetical protein
MLLSHIHTQPSIGCRPTRLLSNNMKTAHEVELNDDIKKSTATRQVVHLAANKIYNSTVQTKRTGFSVHANRCIAMLSVIWRHNFEVEPIAIMKTVLGIMDIQPVTQLQQVNVTVCGWHAGIIRS